MSGTVPASRDEQPARQIARRLVMKRRGGQADGSPTARAAADACGDLYGELSRWVGSDGCDALFKRALARARRDHPALDQIQLKARSDPYVEGVTESIMARGDPATADALESMLAHLVELLGRLIGDDMAMKLIERSLPAAAAGPLNSGRREEA